MVRQFRKARKLLFPGILLLAILMLSVDYAFRNVTRKEFLMVKEPERPHPLLRGELARIIPANFHLLGADDRKLDYILRTALFETPSNYPYQLTNPNIKDFSRGQSSFIDREIKGKTNGFFIEVGAGDGEKSSPSLFFERERQWTGLLIEPNKDLYKQLKSKNRKAITVNSCIRYDKKNGLQDGAFFNPSPAEGNENMSVPCFWLSNYFRSTKRTEIDILFIDLKGHELDLLSTIPFDDVHIEFISIEIPISISIDDQTTIMFFLGKHGFASKIEFTNHIEKEKNLVFQHK